MCVGVNSSTQISVAMYERSMQCRRLRLRVEGGEPRREHYAVHLALSLINGGGEAANAGVVAGTPPSSLPLFPLFPLSFFFFPPFLSPHYFFPFVSRVPFPHPRSSCIFSLYSCDEIVRFSVGEVRRNCEPFSGSPCERGVKGRGGGGRTPQTAIIISAEIFAMFA